MSISFSLLSGTIPESQEDRTLTCTQGSINGLELEAYKRQNERNPLNRWVSKNRALLDAASSPEINSMCFFPSDPRQKQLIFAQKGEGFKEVQGFVIANTELPQESVVEIFTLTNYISISNSTHEFAPAVKRAVRNILSHIVNDEETHAVALNIPHQGQNCTYLWKKC